VYTGTQFRLQSRGRAQVSKSWNLYFFSNFRFKKPKFSGPGSNTSHALSVLTPLCVYDNSYLEFYFLLEQNRQDLIVRELKMIFENWDWKYYVNKWYNYLYNYLLKEWSFTWIDSNKKYDFEIVIELDIRILIYLVKKTMSSEYIETSINRDWEFCEQLSLSSDRK
jgi:hypothetical protein